MFIKKKLMMSCGVAALFISCLSHASVVKTIDVFGAGDKLGLLCNNGADSRLWLRGGLTAASLDDAKSIVKSHYAGWHIATQADMMYVNKGVFGYSDSVWKFGQPYPNHYINPLQTEFDLLGIGLSFFNKELEYISYLTPAEKIEKEMFLIIPGDDVQWGGDPSLANVELVAPFLRETGLKFGLVKDVPEPAPLMMFGLGLLGVVGIRRLAARPIRP